ncbi:MAG: CHAT domain-containing protein [Thermoanaerobaculia bacterium]
MRGAAAAVVLLALAGAALAATPERLEELLARGEHLQSGSVRRHDLAIPVFREAVDLAESTDDARLLARAWVGLGRNLGGVHRYAEAEEALVRGLEHAVDAQDVLLQQTALGYRATFAAEQGETREAESLFASIVDLGERSGNASVEARGLNGLAAMARRRGRAEEAIGRAMEAMRVVEEAPAGTAIAPQLHFQIPYNLGSALGEAGDYGGALVWLERALIAAEADQNLAAIWHVTHDSAVWYQALGDLERAIRYYERALEIAGGAASRDMAAITFRHLAAAELDAGRIEDAAAHFEEALRLFQQHGIREGIPETLIGLARLRAAAGDPDGALRLLGDALEEAGRLQDPGLLVAARLVRGGILIEQGALERARDDFEKAIDLAVEVGLRPLVPAGIEGLARIDEARGELERALEHYEESARLIESMGAAVPSHEQRVAFASATHETFAGMLEVLLELHDRGDGSRGEQAFLALERARTQSLRTTLVRPATRAAPERARIGTLQRKLAAATDAGERIALDRELDDAERRLHALETRVSAGAPPAAIAGLRAHLGADEAFIAYSIADEPVAFVVRREGTRIVKLGALPHLEARVTFFTALLSSGAPGEARVAGQRLARELLAPVLAPAGPRTKRLIFSASGFLAGLPFAALPHPERDEEPLLASYEIGFVGSLTELARIRDRGAPRDADALLAVGFAGTGLTIPVAVAGTTRHLSAIPFSEREVRQVARRMGPATLLAGAEATERALRELPLERFGVIHFASHAVLDPVTPSRSGVVLAAPDRGGDGVLRAREILSWSLDGPLVVLSACATAIGKASAAEGMQSLARAFQLAGARAVVGTMWPIEDRATARLVRELYRALADGATAGEAMRRAQLAIARDDPWGSARHWAAFSVIGDPALTVALPARREGGRVVAFALVGVLILAGWLAIKKWDR